MTAARVSPGLEALLREGPGRSSLRRARLGMIVHPASASPDLRFGVDAVREAGFDLRALFGPQHGARGEKQDNMIESRPYTDPVSGLPVHSLYGDVRKPSPDMLAGLDAVLFDLQDVGVRVYTFIWTMALAMEACAEAGIQFVVLDRPNPVGGERREGPLLRPGFESFVGLHPLPLRHGLTCAEVAQWLNAARGIGCELSVYRCEGWRRDMDWAATGLPWIMPSPNLPTPVSCEAYPGMVLLEGANLSEGRGTTRPFELFGAPWLDPPALADRLNSAGLPGVAFRPCHFEPTFQKHAGLLCGGAQLHVADRRAFQPVRTAVEVLAAARAQAPDDFAWREPPYEYEETLPPIDILWGHDGLRTGIDTGADAEAIMEETPREAAAFAAEVEPWLLY